MLKNVLYFIASIVVFFAGMILYGLILNLSEPSLPEAMVSKGLRYLVNVKLQIDRKNYRLDLYSDTILVKSYKAVFGKSSFSPKEFLNDYCTPVGKYLICDIDTSSKYYKFFRINYPNKNDLLAALKSNQITKQDYDKIYDELDQGNCPTLKDETFIIGIHGIGRLNAIFKNLPFVYNWTNGSIAVSNEDIDEIYSAIKKGTEVVIIN